MPAFEDGDPVTQLSVLAWVFHALGQMIYQKRTRSLENYRGRAGEEKTLSRAGKLRAELVLKSVGRRAAAWPGPGAQGPRHAHGDLTSLAPHERLPESLVAAGSGATEEGLTSRGGRNLRLPLRFGLGAHPAKLPEVMGTSRGNPGFPATPRERPREFFFEAS